MIALRQCVTYGPYPLFCPILSFWQTATTPYEPCSSCTHLYYHHTLLPSPNLNSFQKGGLLSNSCGGFCQSNSLEQWSVQIICACGGRWREHGLPYASVICIKILAYNTELRPEMLDHAPGIPPALHPTPVPTAGVERSSLASMMGTQSNAPPISPFIRPPITALATTRPGLSVVNAQRRASAQANLPQYRHPSSIDRNYSLTTRVAGTSQPRSISRGTSEQKFVIIIVPLVCPPPIYGTQTIYALTID